MNVMKKIELTGFIFIFLAFLSTAEERWNALSEEKNSSHQVVKTYIIGISQCNSIEPFRTEMNRELLYYGSMVPEFKIILKDAFLDNNKQVSDMEGFIRMPCDLIIISPAETQPLTGVVRKAYEKGIPVIVLDRRIEGESYTQFIGGDNYDIGYQVGKRVVGFLETEGGRVLEIMGKRGTSPCEERHKGFMDGISDSPFVTVIDSPSSDWMRERAMTVMDIALSRYNDIDIVFAHNDVSAAGASIIAEKYGQRDSIKFIGVDGLECRGGGVENIKDGIIDVTYKYPTGAREAIESCSRILIDKETVPKELILETKEINPGTLK